MPTPRPHGTPIDAAEVPAWAKAVLDAGLGDNNMLSRGLTLGSGANGEDVGRHDAVFARVAVPSSSSIVEVAHALGRVPSQVIPWSVEAGPSGDCVAAVSSVSKKDWTSTTVKVRIHPIAGVVTGSVAVLVVT